MKRKGEKILKPVHPNVGISAEYRAKLDAMIEAMHRSYVYFLKAQYRETPPLMAQDATPAKELQRELSKLGKRWERRIDEGAPKLARWFARSASRRSQASLQKILKDAGMSVEFQVTPVMRDAFQATLFENTALIKSISSEYHAQVSGIVMRSVSAGRDLSILAKEVEARYGVTKRRAAFIARSQNNLATATFTKIRQQEAGIEHAIWQHSMGGKEPRVSHLKNSGNKYRVSEGWLDPEVNKRIWPGQLPNCRCVARAVVRGFN